MIDNQWNDEKRMRYPLAIFLSSLIFLVWMHFFGPERVAQKNSQSLPQPQQDLSAKQLSPKVIAQQQNSFQDKDSKKSHFIFTERTFSLKNEAMEIQLSNKNAIVISARVRDRLGRHKGKMSDFSPDFEMKRKVGFETGRLVFFNNSENLLFLQSQANEDFQTIYSDEQKVIFTTTLRNTKGLIKLTKTYQLTEDPYRLDLTISIIDKSTGKQSPLPYYILNGSHIGMDDNIEKSSLDVERLSCQRYDENTEMLSPAIFGTDKTFDTCSAPFDWISLDNRFYARILKPNKSAQKAFFGKEIMETMNSEIQESYHFSSVLMAGNQEETTVSWYYLPKNRQLLKKYHDKADLYFYDLFHQFSFMHTLSSVMYWFLNFINGFTGNYGWSILLMTFLIKTATFPLTQKSLKSMERMRQLSPKIEAIKKAYKNDSQRVSMEMMNLYKKEGVNPLSGCLPMMIPLPIFIALYSLFQNMVELQGSSFMWIKDLSLPDTVMQLGFSLPFLGNNVKILPIIMTISSFAQSALPNEMPTAENPQMKNMKYVFPILFFFICWKLPSALVLFWTAQNVFSLIQTITLRQWNTWTNKG